MVTAEPPAGITTFTYDAVGQRASRETPTELTEFQHDFKRLLREHEGGNETRYVSLLEEYGDYLSIVEPTTGDLNFYCDDALGTELGLIDTSGTVNAEYVVRAFGEPESVTGLEQPHTFVGRQGYYWESDLQLYMQNSPYYDPYAGRMLSPDPLGFSAGDYNLYRPVRNNIVNWTDPSGMDPVGKTTDGSLPAFLDYLASNFGFVEGKHLTVDRGVTKYAGMSGTILYREWTDRRWLVQLNPEYREFVRKFLIKSYKPDTKEANVLQSLVDYHWNVQVDPQIRLMPTELEPAIESRRADLSHLLATGQRLAPERGFMSYFMGNPGEQNQALASLQLLGSMGQAATGTALILLGGPVGWVAGAWLLYRSAEGAVASGATLKDKQPRKLGTDIMIAEGYKALALKAGMSEEAATFAGESAVFLLGFLEGGAGVAQAKKVVAASRAGKTSKSGLTMLGGSTKRLASSQAELDMLFKGLLETAKSEKFIRRAKQLGFSDEQIARLPARIADYHRRGQIGWIRSGGWADESNLLIGRGGMFRQSSRMRHELGHVLDEIANPGLMARSLEPKSFGFMGYFRAEMTAFGTQLHPFNPARPWLAGLTAAHNRFGYLGSVPFMVGSAFAAYESEKLLLDLLLGE